MAGWGSVTAILVSGKCPSHAHCSQLHSKSNSCIDVIGLKVTCFLWNTTYLNTVNVRLGAFQSLYVTVAFLSRK